jgi:hypothetical protein
MIKTSMTQRSRMMVNITNHQKKLRRRRQIRGKTKNTRVKKIWQEKEKEKVAKQEGKMLQTKMKKRKSLNMARKRKRKG